MSHELVFRFNEALNANVALMMYVKRGEASVPWHGYGQAVEEGVTCEDMAQICGFDRVISLEDITSRGRVLEDRRAVWDSEERYLGTVGPDYKVHQDSALVDVARGYETAGLATLDTAGMLKGGSRIWISMTIKGSEQKIADGENGAAGDYVRTNLFLGQGHDGTLAIVQGDSDIRAVCNNTVSMILRESEEDPERFFRVRHTANLAVNMQEAEKEVAQRILRAQKRVEAYRFLAATPVAGVAALNEFLAALKGGKEPSERSNGLSAKILPLFSAGIGNTGRTWWHLLNAVTQSVTHGLGNNLKGDIAGDQEARALNKAMFGAGNKLTADAFRIAVNLAAGKPANAKLTLAA